MPELVAKLLDGMEATQTFSQGTFPVSRFIIQDGRSVCQERSKPWLVLSLLADVVDALDEGIGLITKKKNRLC